MIPKHLQGPWGAFLLDEEGYAYQGTDELDETDWEGLQVVIVRATAMPTVRREDALRIPRTHDGDDLIWVVQDETFLGDLDQARIWIERARAMAAGLNSVAEEVL